jgi:hypothetical protein
MSRTLTALLAALALAAIPSTADAKTFRGKTNQGRSALLVTGADGVPTRVDVHWIASCKKPGWRTTGGTRVTPPFTAVSADVVRDGPKTYRTRLRDGSRARITATLAVRRSGSRWKGTFKLRELVSRKGKVVDVCHIKRLRFTLR